jgi:hypothetical protein
MKGSHRMRLRTRLSIAAGVGAAGMLAGPALAASPSRAASPRPVAVLAASPSPASVAIVTPLLNVMRTGSTAGPGVLKGVLLTVAGSYQLPPPANRAQQVVIAAINSVSATMSTQGPVGITALQKAIAPLACANPAITAVANGMDAGATAFANVIQPFDRSAHQTATLLRSFEAPKGASC